MTRLELMIVEERDLTNRWSMWGSDCISKVGRFWDSGVPSAPLFKTKKVAWEYLTQFVCSAVPLRCSLREV